MTVPMSFARYCQFYEHFTGKPHQIEGLRKKYERELAADPTILTEDEDWRKTFSTAVRQPTTNPLRVPYFWQQDNGADGWRQCQTSAIAMCLAFKGVNAIRDDLDYLRYVRKHGDTTHRPPHFGAMREIGFQGFQWHEGGPNHDEGLSAIRCREEIDNGNPVAVGVLHHGPVHRPIGGGHFIVLIGYTQTHWICHDPYGELMLASGGWANRTMSAGRGVKYSFKNLNPRIFVKGPNDGWGWTFL
jgi:hypothetical protein